MSTVVLEGSGFRHVVQDGRISAESDPATLGDARRLDCDGDGVAVRGGGINAHTHLYSGLAPLGLPSPRPEPRSFVEILERVWWRLDRALDPPSLRAAARLYIAEALLAGTTTLVDHHESPGFIDGSLEILADAAVELGARLIVTYGATERNGGIPEAKRGLAECRRFIRSNRRPLVRGMVGLHASFTVSDETVRETGTLSRELGAKVHVHLAEDQSDVEDAKRRGFPGPLERFLALEGLTPGSVLAHGVHLDRAQAQRAGEAGFWLVQNPRSNEANRVGYAGNVWKSDKLALGTDGFASDMRSERAALVRLARSAGIPEDLERLDRREAGSYGLASALFEVELRRTPVLGCAADLVVGNGSGDPRHVLVAGEVVVKDGRLTRADVEEIRARAREQATRLFRRMAELK